jgi:hypothetical protein
MRLHAKNGFFRQGSSFAQIPAKRTSELMSKPPSNASTARTPARRKGARALATLVPDAMAGALRERGFASSAILTEWPEIVGPHLAKWAHPLEIRWPRRTEGPAPAMPPPGTRRAKTESASRAVLVIACPGAFALDLQMAGASVIEAVNRRLGFGCIGSIQILQRPQPAPVASPASRILDPERIKALEAGMGDIVADDLREALARLGAQLGAGTGIDTQK